MGRSLSLTGLIRIAGSFTTPLCRLVTAASGAQPSKIRLRCVSVRLGDRVGERLFGERIGVGRAVFLILRTVAEAGPEGWCLSRSWRAG
jgi:hypothetical protein